MEQCQTKNKDCCNVFKKMKKYLKYTKLDIILLNEVFVNKRLWNDIPVWLFY